MENREVRDAAAFAAEKLELDRPEEKAGVERGPTIASIHFESVLAAAVTQNGDHKLGERLFQRQGCACVPHRRSRRGLQGPSLLGGSRIVTSAPELTRSRS